MDLMRGAASGNCNLKMAQIQNKVELIGTYGGDIEHACSAWTSTSRSLTEDKVARMGKLLTMLAQDGHHTPFEKSTLHFLVDVETASHIHIIKHRIAVSVNGESARYKELKADKYHIPADWPTEEQDLLRMHCEQAFERYHACLKRLIDSGVDRKRAKESARFYLPYANSLTLDVSFNFRSFMSFQKLRNDDHAQLEIHQIAQKMLDLVKAQGSFDLSLKAFGY
jgi:flavin-dependent thymidylate synthase